MDHNRAIDGIVDSNMQNQTDCRLLDLPQEIRDHIYHLVLVADNAILDQSPKLSQGLTPDLLATCNQIHKEAEPILYSKNIIAFKHPSDCSVFLRGRHQGMIRDVCHVEFRIKEDRFFKMWTSYFQGSLASRHLFADLPNLVALDIYLQQNSWGFGVDLDEAIKTWHSNRTLRHLCLSLEGQTPEHSEVTIMSSMRIGEPQLNYLRQSTPHLFAEMTPTWARTKPVVIRVGTTASLELISSKINMET